jgi:hypothetical protein
MAETRDLVRRLLDTTDIALVVPSLPPEVLQRLVDRCGLEACVDLVALTTPSQLRRLLDSDLWRADVPGRDETFDAGRFGEWIEVLIELGVDVAGDRVAAMDLDLVVDGLAAHARVFDAGAVSSFTTLDGEQMGGRAFRGGEVAAIGGFVLEGQESSAWDAIVELLAHLQSERPAFFHRLMRGCVDLSSRGREMDPSYDLLDARDYHRAALSFERAERRNAQGYVTPAEARAFLQAARGVRLDGDRPDVDPVAFACLRDLAQASVDHETSDSGAEGLQADAPPGDRAASVSAAARVTAVMQILVDEGLVTPPRALLTAGTAQKDTPLEHVRALVAADPASEPTLAFLVNVLLSGCPLLGRPFTAQEAADAAAATCNLGLENWPVVWGRPDLVIAFRIGWTLLYHDVCLHAARTLCDVLAGIGGSDRDHHWSLQTLRHALARELERGTPWRVRESLDAIVSLDACAWAGLLALLDEYPTLHAALTSRRLLRVDPAEVSFVTRNADVAVARTWLATLASALG